MGTKEERFNIKVNEPCPCGSGEIFKSCCMKKKQEYYTLGKNYEGKEMVFNQTKNMENYDEITKFFLENIYNVIEKNDTFAVSKALDHLKVIYEKVDKGLNQFSGYAPCQKGCGTCCSLYLECTPIEAELIRRYVKDNFSQEEIDNIILRLKCMNEQFEQIIKSSGENKEEIIKKYLDRKQPCIFLTKENSCGLYEVRPLVCRSFIVFSAAENCKGEGEIIRPALAPANIGRIAINQLSMAVVRFKNMHEIVNNEKTPVMKPLIQWFNNGFHDINRKI
ncbi:hypothetical protein CPJCM30710_00280 [Clostridium polyendosporum]|uniref:Zinc-or iron-chelating domain-containing protein n=1 Tax=Clostridium polyendosporum TaxID=69208 RepID=A0A919VEQ8_9CLOT|nr:SEC-C motif-containing protein [Clostridium polyendosporum]GIM27362.1 hypothetical protein CPJCM30710_00280 [Clostridium polyendosporum]